MGFLDHTTNNIVIDAVLTERGRELLAKNDGSFRIDGFAFGDDEVDYSNIIKYGINIGKEKIEKNTPIFEAQTNENHALKYNNITLSSSNIRILYIPVLKEYEGLTAGTPIQLTSNSSSNSVVSQKIKILSTLPVEAGQIAIDPNLADTRFYIKMNSLLLTPYSNGVADSNYIDLDENEVGTWQVNGTTAFEALTGDAFNFKLDNRYLLTLDIGLIANLKEPAFEKFGTLTNNNGVITGSINTYVEIIGGSSGSRLLVPINITLA